MTDLAADRPDAQRRDRTLFRERLTFLLLGAVTVSLTVTAATFVDAGAAIAATVGLLVALAILGWALWRSAPVQRDHYQNLGTGLLVSVVVAGAVGGAQLAIEHRQAARAERSEARERQLAEKESLRVALGLQERLVGIDLDEKDLSGLYLGRKWLVDAQFRNAKMRGVILDRAVLSGAVLRSADLTGATLFRANLRHADLGSANLTGAQLNQAGLRGANLTGAKLKDAKLSTNLRGHDLHDGDLRGASLDAAKLHGANLAGANLDGASLTDAELRYARLVGTHLRDAVLLGADLSSAALTRADLRGADLSGAALAGAEFSGALVNAGTRWPDCVVPPQGTRVPAGWTAACT